MEPYAGQPMTNGQQAKAYADHYIGSQGQGGRSERRATQLI